MKNLVNYRVNTQYDTFTARKDLYPAVKDFCDCFGIYHHPTIYGSLWACGLRKSQFETLMNHFETFYHTRVIYLKKDKVL